ncbi:TPA: hypothetical protein QDB06_000875 [Burkholderia vietnamiensis]|nr:hypothetical protein [Burkholderia vietnamiensis]
MSEEKKKAATASKPRRPTELDTLTRMKVKLWMDRVLKIAGCSATQLPNRYHFDLGMVKFGMYVAGERAPEGPTVFAVSQGHKASKPAEKPFLETRELYESGPEGSLLWEVLEGGIASCENAVEAAFLSDSVRVTGFGQAVATAYTALLDEQQAQEAREFINEQGKPNEFGYLFEVMRWFLLEELEHPMVSNVEEGRNYSVSMLVGCIALWQLSQEYKSLQRECDFLAVGAFHVLKNRFEIIKPELNEFMQAKMLKKVGNAF